jgi:hypothetical protein
MDPGWAYYPIINWGWCIAGLIHDGTRILMLNSLIGWTLFGRALRSWVLSEYDPWVTTRLNQRWLRSRDSVAGWLIWHWPRILLAFAVIVNVWAISR